jgi:hypothetical protein
VVPSSIAALEVRLAEASVSFVDPGQASVPLLFDHAAEQFCAARSFTEGILNKAIAVGASVCVGCGVTVSVGTLVGAITD